MWRPGRTDGKPYPDNDLQRRRVHEQQTGLEVALTVLVQSSCWLPPREASLRLLHGAEDAATGAESMAVRVYQAGHGLDVAFLAVALLLNPVSVRMHREYWQPMTWFSACCYLDGQGIGSGVTRQRA